MPGIYDTPQMKVSQPDNSVDFSYTDEHGGLLAKAVQIIGPPPRKGISKFFEPGDFVGDRPHVALRVDDAAGTPMFYLDRQPGQVSVAQIPVTVQAANGMVYGRVEHNTAKYIQSVAPSMMTAPITGWVAGAQSHRLVDAHGTPVCEVAWEEFAARAEGGRTHGASQVAFLDAKGVMVAEYGDEGILRLLYQLPEPMRTLILAAPVALTLMALGTDG
ncbi:MAG TPA: hypothetical protein VGF17_15570 [Phytomonospora sp.]